MIKNYNFFRKHFHVSSFFKFFPVNFFFFLIFSGAIGKTFAQTQFPHITWVEVKQYPDDLVQMGDEGYIKIHIYMTNDPINYIAWQRPRIQVTLPMGIDFSNAGSASLVSPTGATTVATTLISDPGVTPVSYFQNATATGNALTGSPTFRTLNFDYNRPTLAAALLPLGDSLVLKVRIRALINVNQFNPGAVTVKVSSLNNQLMTGGDTRTCQLNVVKPVLRLRPTFNETGLVIFNNILDTMPITLALDCQNGHARSAYIRYTYTGTIVSIDSVKLDGVPLAILPSNSGSGVNFQSPTSATSYLHIRLDQSNLKGNITSVPRIISFRATVNRGCNRTLTPLWQNPLTNQAPSTTNDQWSENPIILDVPGNTTSSVYHTQNTVTSATATPTWGNNAIQMRTIPRFNPNNPTDLSVPFDLYAQNHYFSFCHDGKTPNYMALVFNEYPPQSSAITFQFATQTWYNGNLSPCEYIDTSQIYYRVILPSKLNRNIDSLLLVPVTKINNTDRDFYGRLCIDPTNGYPTTNAENILHYAPILHNKSRSMTLRLPGIGMANPLPAGAKVEFQWVVYGNPEWINDEYRSRASFMTTSTQNRHCMYWLSPQYENTCGVNGNYGGNLTSEILKPHFYNPPLPRIPVYSHKTFFWSNNCYTGGNNTTAINNPTNDPTGPRYAELFVKMPGWLNLDTIARIDDAFIIRHRDSTTFHPSGVKPTLNSGIYHGLDAQGYKTYSVKYHTNSGGANFVVDIRLIPGDCPLEVVMLDTLQVWWDWVSGDRQRNASTGQVEPCRAVFKKTSKVWTELEFICTPPALAIDTFGVFRITRGLKDSNNDHIPDDGTLALDNEIQHWHFLQGDTGYYFFKGYVGGSTSQRWDQLVLVLRFGTGGAIGATQQYKWGNTGHARPFWDKGTIEIKRWIDDNNYTLFTLPLTIPVVNSQDSIIIYYDGGGNDYVPRGGDSCYIKVPFICHSGLATTTMRGLFYVITYGIKPLDPKKDWVNKFFPDHLYRIVHRNINLYNRGTTSVTFNNPCVPQNITDLYTNTYHAGDEVSNWTREVRYRHKLEKIVFTVPRGYSRTNDKFYIRPAMWHNGSNTSGAIVWTPDVNSVIEVKPDLCQENFATQDSIFTIDMKKYVDYDFDGTQFTFTPADLTNFNTYGLLPNGKYSPGDDVGGAYCAIKQLYATPASAQANLTGVFSYTNHLGQVQNQNMGATTLYYNGRRNALDLQRDVMMFTQYAFTNLKIQNSHASLTNQNNWLYVDGNVEDAYLVNQLPPKDTIWGTGLRNCWLPLGTMLGGEVRNYFLVYSYMGSDVCANDTIVVYSVFDGEHIGYVPDIENGIEKVANCNRGQKGYTILDLMTARIKVAGHIVDNIPNPIKPGFFHYKSGYSIDYVINGKVSQGALNDASVTFRIPVGQIYVDTIAQFLKASYEYPQNSGFKELPQAILDTLEKKIGKTSDPSEIREVTIHIKDILEKTVFMLPGFGTTPMNFQDADRMFTIRIPLLPLCETDLTGTRFRAVYNGKTFCGAPCEDDGTVYTSRSFFPDNYPEYDFKVSIKQLGYSRVYSYEQRNDILLATFQKDRGVFLYPVEEETDFVLLRLSENIVVNGNIYCPQFDKIINVLDEWVNTQGERFYKLELPAKELNNLLGESPPRDSLTFHYRIPIEMIPDLVNFDCSSPKQELECSVISLANFGDPPTECSDEPFNVGSGSFSVITLNYDPDQFQVCKDMQNPLTLACGGLTPIWYRDSVGTGGMLIANNTFVYTPTLQKDTTFWIRIFYDYNGPLEENIGLTKIKIKMFPLVTSAFNFEASCIGQETQMRNASTIGTEQSDETNTLSWLWYLNGSTTPFSTEREPKLLLNTGDRVRLLVISKDGCQHSSEKIAAPFPLPIPTITGSLDTCFNSCITYKTQSGMTDYVWTVSNGTPQTPLSGRDSIVVCWNKQSSPIAGMLGVVYTNSNGCRALPKEDVARVIIRVPPETPEISGNNSPCQYSQYTYNFVHQDNIIYFYWNVTGGIIVAGGNGYNYITIFWTDPGQQEITLNIANRAGCEAVGTGVFQANVKTVARPTIAGNSTLCIFDTDTYTTAAGMTNYVWNIIGGTIQSGTGTNQISVKWNTAGTGKMVVRYNDENVCPALMVDTFKVIVHPLPVPTISGSNAECFEECTEYTTQSGMSNYVWTVTNGTIDGSGNLSNVTICWDDIYGDNIGKVSVSYTDGNGCTAAAPTQKDNITVYALPATPVILGDEEVCYHSEITYKYQQQFGFTIAKYVWSVTSGTVISGGNSVNSGNGCDSITVRWTDAGVQTITLSITDAHGCKPYNTGSLQVEVEGEVKADFSFTTVCFNNPTQFTNLSKIGTANSESGNTHKWYWYQNLSTTPFDSVQHPAKTLNLGDSVRLQVISKFGCVDEITKVISIDTLPVPTISGSNAECFKECTVYKTEKGMSNYIWTVAHGTIKNGINNRDSVIICWDNVYGAFIGEVGINYTNGKGCMAALPTVKDNITIFALPSNLVILGNEAPCYDTDALYEFEHQASFTATQFLWTISEGEIISGGTGTDSIRVKWPGFGTYEIILGIMDDLGCVPDSLARKKIEVKGEYPTINGEDWACLGIPGNFYETKTGMVDYNWYIDGGTIVAGSNSNRIDVKWNIPGNRKLSVSYLDPSINCTLFMIDTFEVYVIPCQISNCMPLNDKFVVEDSVGKGFYTHRDTDWDLQPLAGFSFDSVRYIINGNIYDSGVGASLLNAKFPVRKTSRVIAVGYFYGIPDTCEFTVKVIMACPDTVHDVESHIYDVTALVGLCWTTNLMTTTYADGTPITFANPYSCPECPNPTEAGEIFGLLYTWYSALKVTEGDNGALPATTQGICPDGWRLPTLYELMLLNGYPVEELKSENYWLLPGNNTTGFSSLPAGMYSGALGNFVNLYGFTAYWSSDSEANIYAFYYSISYFCDVGKSVKSSKTDGFSVRCVLDFEEE